MFGLDIDQGYHSVGPDPDSNCLKHFQQTTLVDKELNYTFLTKYPDNIIKTLV